MKSSEIELVKALIAQSRLSRLTPGELQELASKSGMPVQLGELDQWLARFIRKRAAQIEAAELQRLPKAA